jgi:20S proteasome subunit beta 1
MPEDTPGKGISTGTTIMAVKFDGGVVMGADSRTSTGIYVANRVSDKIAQLHDNIYCCRSGSAADTQAVTDYVRRFLQEHSVEKGTDPLVRNAAHLVRQICYENKERLMAGMIVAGFDTVAGGQIFTIPLGGSLIEQNVAVGGSGSTFILGLIDAYYKPGMSKEECVAFVKQAISHAMARDGSSGGVIRTVTITADGVERSFTPGDRLPFMLAEAPPRV